MVQLLRNSSRFNPAFELRDTVFVLVDDVEEPVELSRSELDFVFVEHLEHLLLVELVWISQKVLDLSSSKFSKMVLNSSFRFISNG